MTYTKSFAGKLWPCVFFVVPCLLLASGCEMQLKRVADEIYYVHLEDPDQAQDVVLILRDFADQFDAQLQGGKREREGTNRQVYELYFASDMQINVSNFVNEMQFIVAIYSGDEPDYSRKSAVLLTAMESAGMQVGERSIND